MKKMLKVQLLYAHTPEFCMSYDLELPMGATIEQAIDASGILAQYPSLKECSVGIWGHLQLKSQILEAGDRIELYRPLNKTAMQARALRSQLRKTKGKLY